MKLFAQPIDLTNIDTLIYHLPEGPTLTMKTEGIEALFYPSEETRCLSAEEQEARFQEILDEVNHGLKSYQKISRFTVLDEAMEMTTTKKIKRFKVAQAG